MKRLIETNLRIFISILTVLSVDSSQATFWKKRKFSRTAQRSPKHLKALIDVKKGFKLFETKKQHLAQLLSAVDEQNQQVPGAFQVGYWNANPYVTYIHEGVSYHYLSGKDELKEGQSKEEKEIARDSLSKQTLKKRFARPKNFLLIGLETNIWGNILPIFSDKNTLTYYRDETEKVNRVVSEIPLTLVKYQHLLDPNHNQNKTESLMARLPEAYRYFLENNVVPITKESAKHIHSEYLVSLPESLNLVALMVHEKDGFNGRMGILLQDSAPLLTRIGEQEYFFEDKGVGIPIEAKNHEDLFTTRDEIPQKWGRANVANVHLAFNGHRVIRERLIKDDPIGQRLLSFPLFGFSLPEHYTERKIYHRGGNLSEDEQVGQIHRLSTSTCRLAYCENPSYSQKPYVDRSHDLTLAQKLFGDVVSTVFLHDEDPYYPYALHSQNMVTYKAFGKILPTDFCDIMPVEVEAHDLSWTSVLKEFKLFGKDSDNSHFISALNGGKNSVGGLNEKWIRLFDKAQLSYEQFQSFLTQQIISKRRVALAIKRNQPGLILPSIDLDNINFHMYQNFANGTKGNWLFRGEGWEYIWVKKTFDSLVQLVETLTLNVEEVTEAPTLTEEEKGHDWIVAMKALASDLEKKTTKLKEDSDNLERFNDDFVSINQLFFTHLLEVGGLLDELYAFQSDPKLVSPEVKSHPLYKKAFPSN